MLHFFWEIKKTLLVSNIVYLLIKVTGKRMSRLKQEIKLKTIFRIHSCYELVKK